MSEKFSIACPKCKKRLKIPAAAKGKKAKCPSCQASFRIGGTKKQANQTPVVKVSSASEVSRLESVSSSRDSPSKDLLAPHGNQGSFQERLAKHQGGQPKKRATRKEKLQKARQKNADQAAWETGWQTASYGVMMIVLAFFSTAMPDADAVNASGKLKIVVKLLHSLGSFAPLVGMFIGLAGVGIIVVALEKIPKLISLVGGAIVALMIVAACGASFLSATGLDTKLAKSRAHTNQNVADFGAEFQNQKEEQKQSMANFGGFAREGNPFNVGDDAGNSRSQEDEARESFKLSSNENFDSDVDADESRNWSGSPILDENPFPAGDAKEASENPFAASEENVRSENSFSAINNAMEDPSAAERFSQKESPFDSDAFGGRFAGNGMDTMARRSELARRAIQGSESLIQLRMKGFSTTVPLELGAGAGTTKSRMGMVFYQESPILGVAFMQGPPTYLVPTVSGEVDQSATSAKEGEKLYGFNLNFDSGKLIGIQGVFSVLEGANLNKPSLTTGNWLGEEPSGGKFETIVGNGIPVHGFLIVKKGFSIVGLQLVVEK